MKDLVDQLRVGVINSIKAAAKKAKNNGEIDFVELPDFSLEVPREKGHGDLATNLAMLLTKQAKKAPRQIAEAIANNFEKEGTWVTNIEIAGPGFINFFIDSDWVYETLSLVEAQKESFGCSNLGQGQKIQVEFVSANPTGLLHMGNARGAALGDTISSLLKAAGYQVSKEFYINDAGNQIENFAKSLEARYLQELGFEVTFPDEGYHGQDVVDTMKNLIARDGDKYVNVDPSLRKEMLVKFALEEKLNTIKAVLLKFGVKYDVWFSEQSLHDSGAVEEVLSDLKAKDYIYEHEGALWFKSTQFGDPKDEVVVRSNGTPTYFAADIAYHKNKFDRGFNKVINIWGADHHGHVARMKGAVKAVGYDPEALEVIIMQLVRLYKGGDIVRMSKRSGQFVTLEDLVDEVGKDAARYFFVMRSADSHLDFDLDLAKSQSNDNPVFYIQYAHARICSILRQAEENGIAIPKAAQINPKRLTEAAELELLKKVAGLTCEIKEAAEALAPHRVARYAHELAGNFHTFYNNCRVIVDDHELRDARLVLIDATRQSLKNILTLLGISAPEKM